MDLILKQADIKYALGGISSFAIRVSEIESEDSAILLLNELNKHDKSIDWVWADCFSGNPINYLQHKHLKNLGLKICYVSPELHHLSTPNKWKPLLLEFMSSLRNVDIVPDMVCTKLPEAWKNFT